MSQELINHNADLKKLRDEGLNIEARNGLLLVHDIPYLNSNCEIKRGTLVSELTLAGDKTIKPNTHVIHFAGEYPCNKDSTPIEPIRHQSKTENLKGIIQVDHSFSNKPKDGYGDYYEKVTTYIKIISGPAKSLDNSVTEKVFRVIESQNDDSVFNYCDTNSSRAGILDTSSKLENQKIAVIGLGGTGSYILDMVSKTLVKEIHLFDGDQLLSHNAFRSPGAPSIESLRMQINKTEYFKQIYSAMHKNIFAHAEFISAENLDDLKEMDFVFICIDKNNIKQVIFNKLVELGISFIDVGMGIEVAEDGSLLGIIRTTTSTEDNREHVKDRITLSENTNDAYSSNIQIAELNALNASLAVIKWKKLNGFYNDQIKEHNTNYVINTGQLLNEDEA